MKVYRLSTSISGSLWVIWLNSDEYIDARLDVRKPDFVHLEYVYHGQIRATIIVSKEMALAAALEWLRWQA